MNTTEKNYYPYFDYARFILATMVMLSHDNIIHWYLAGSLAVDVFFALSGWLIGTILLNTSKEDLPKFYFNRAVRIWIPYYIAFIFVVAASVLKDPVDAKWIEFVIYKFTWVYNLFGPPQLLLSSDAMPLDGTANHFWSVNAEEQFYLLAPVLLVILGVIGKSVITWAIVAISLLLADTYAAISFGVLAATIKYHYGDYHEHLICKIFVGIILLLSSFALFYDFYIDLAAPFFAISLVLLLTIKGKKHKLGVFLGGISYPLYLNHWIGVFLFNALLDPLGLRDSPLRQFLASIFSIILAALLYQFIEKVCMKHRNRFFSQQRGKLVTLIAYSSMLCGLIYAYSLDNNFTKLVLISIFACSGLTVYWVIAKNNTKKEIQKLQTTISIEDESKSI
jgi:peptidoglycan/LPS O-acetylase OafA/YrhL